MVIIGKVKLVLDLIVCPLSLASSQTIDFGVTYSARIQSRIPQVVNPPDGRSCGTISSS
jgi:hypothetical protein